MDSQNTSVMDEIGTLINHETEPHCCGCYTIQYGNNGVGLRAMCNECGHTVDLMPLLASPIGSNNFGYPATPAPLSPDVEAAVEFLQDFARRNPLLRETCASTHVLLRAVRASRLTAPLDMLVGRILNTPRIPCDPPVPEWYITLHNDATDLAEEVTRGLSAPRLTGEQRDAIKNAYAVAQDFRAAFPEAYAGELGEVESLNKELEERT